REPAVLVLLLLHLREHLPVESPVRAAGPAMALYLPAACGRGWRSAPLSDHFPPGR
ncbi:unnamed protein product, partial [Symbiodinium microadriaticum]